MGILKHVAIILLFSLLAVVAKSQDLEIYFLADSISVTIDDQFRAVASTINKLDSTNQTQILQKLNRMYSENQLHKTRASLARIKSMYNLNDWFTYALLGVMADKIYGYNTGFNKKVILKWFLLNKLNYDARLFEIEGFLTLYIYSHDSSRNSIIHDLKTFIGLNNVNIDFNLHPVDIILTTSGDPFSLKILPFPKLNERKGYMTGYYRVLIDRHYYSLDIEFPFDHLRYLEDYPSRDRITFYFDIPFSDSVRATMINVLAKLTTQKSTFSRINSLLSFVRDNFPCTNDYNKYSFGYEKKMIPEQVIYYHGGDLADLTGFMYELVKEIVKAPMILIKGEGDDEFVLGIYLEDEVYKGYEYKGKNWVICDLRKKRLERHMQPNIKNPIVIGEYNPKEGFLKSVGEY